jgi:hypothetical protein
MTDKYGDTNSIQKVSFVRQGFKAKQVQHTEPNACDMRVVVVVVVVVHPFQSYLVSPCSLVKACPPALAFGQPVAHVK